LGRPQFTRLPRGVEPTPAAELLASRVADPLDQLAALNAVKSAVVAGAGFSVLPDHLCAEALRTGDLVLLREPALPPINTLAARAGDADRPRGGDRFTPTCSPG
jgi:DNA-binding transcriptional LysR family regulator